MSPFGDNPTESRPSFLSQFTTHPALVAFLICLVLGSLVVLWRARLREDNTRGQAGLEARVCLSAIESELLRAVAAAEILGSLAQQSGGTIPNFQKIASDLLTTHRIIATLELQPNSTWAYYQRGTTLSGPLRLHRGELGFVARAPLYQRMRDERDALSGFVAVSLRQADLLAKARLTELHAKGYDYILFPEGSPQAIAAQGRPSSQDALRQSVVVRNYRLCLAVETQGGWSNRTRLSLEFLGVLCLSALACLLVNLIEVRREIEASLTEANRRLDREVAERKQAQDDLCTVKDAAAGTQADLKQTRLLLHQTEARRAEFEARLEKSLRAAADADNAAQARHSELVETRTALEQAQLRLGELETQIDAARRANQEAASTVQARQVESDRALEALQKSQDETTQLVSRLESTMRAQQESEAAARARHEQDQATIAHLQERLEASTRAAAERAEADAATLRQLEEATRALQARLPEPRQAESPEAPLSAETEPAQPAPPTQSEPAPASTPAPSLPEPSSQVTVPPLAAPSAEPNELSAPVSAEQTPLPAEEEKAGLEPAALLQDKVQDKENETPQPEQASPAVPLAPNKPPKRKKARRDAQMDLFGAPAEENGESAPAPPAEPAQTPAAIALDLPLPTETSPLTESKPTSQDTPTAVPAEEPAEAVAPVSPEPPTPAPAQAEPAPMPSALALPSIEGLVPETGLAKAHHNPKLYLKALQEFAEHQAGVPEQVRDALVQGDTAGAERMVHELLRSTETIGAVALGHSASALAAAIRSQSDPANVEFLWAEFEKILKALLAELRPLVKPKEDKPARRLPPAPPLNPGQFRKATSQILPLLVDHDPGAKDCLKDNRNTFRSGFTPEGYVEFEQSVKGGDYALALDLLRKAAKKHGISA